MEWRENIFHNVTGSVNSERAHPSSPGICGAFVFSFSEPLQLRYGRGSGPGDSHKDLMVGLKLECKCPTPGQH